MIEEDKTQDVMSNDQRQRVVALKQARAVLVERGALSSGKISSIVDLITTAQWIIDGNDPWPADNQPDESDVEAEDELGDEPPDEGIQADR